MKNLNILIIFFFVSCGRNNKTANVTFYAENYCEEYEIYIDNDFKGTIYEFGKIPNCNEGEINISLTQGNHILKVKNNCVDINETLYLEKGECYLFKVN